MPVNFKILIPVACAVVIAGAAVVIVTNSGSSGSVVESIPTQGLATIDRSPAGLQMQASSAGLTLSVPDCDVKKFPDKFFLHLFTEAGLRKAPVESINLDFNLAQEKGVESVANGVKTCTYHKSFSEFPAKELTIGQFTTPNNQCCTLTWSRSYIFDKTLPGKP